MSERERWECERGRERESRKEREGVLMNKMMGKTQGGMRALDLSRGKKLGKNLGQKVMLTFSV